MPPPSERLSEAAAAGPAADRALLAVTPVWSIHAGDGLLPQWPPMTSMM